MPLPSWTSLIALPLAVAAAWWGARRFNRWAGVLFGVAGGVAVLALATPQEAPFALGLVAALAGFATRSPLGTVAAGMVLLAGVVLHLHDADQTLTFAPLPHLAWLALVGVGLLGAAERFHWHWLPWVLAAQLAAATQYLATAQTAPLLSGLWPAAAAGAALSGLLRGARGQAVMTVALPLVLLALPWVRDFAQPHPMVPFSWVLVGGCGAASVRLAARGRALALAPLGMLILYGLLASGVQLPAVVWTALPLALAALLVLSLGFQQRG